MSATEVRDAVSARIETELKRANGRRRERTVGTSITLSCLLSVIEGKPFSGCHGGTVANAYQNAASTTFVLAARVDGKVYLGITTADAKSTTAGRAWQQLQPWRDGEGPRGDAAAKWLAWTQAGNVFYVDGPTCDAIIEAQHEMTGIA